MENTARCKRIYVLFTSFNDRLSWLLNKVYGHNYSHASISLDDEHKEFYSFTIKGFSKETSEKFSRHGVNNGLCYEILVSEQQYLQIQNRLESFSENRENYRYSYLGVFFCLLRLPFRQKNHYFCSQFVAETLGLSNAVSLKKKFALYMPEDLRNELNINNNQMLCF